MQINLIEEIPANMNLVIPPECIDEIQDAQLVDDNVPIMINTNIIETFVYSEELNQFILKTKHATILFSRFKDCYFLNHDGVQNTIKLSDDVSIIDHNILQRGITILPENIILQSPNFNSDILIIDEEDDMFLLEKEHLAELRYNHKKSEYTAFLHDDSYLTFKPITDLPF